jgi:hypothetical protein
MSRYHRIDAWRGYRIPQYAVAGASDTGTAPDSPCPSGAVAKELIRFGKECLHTLGIKYRTVWGVSSNCFCSKRWITVKKTDFDKAALAASTWLNMHKDDTYYIHNGE